MVELNSSPLISTPLTLRLMKNNVDEDFLNYDNKKYDDGFAYDNESFQSRCSHYTTVVDFYFLSGSISEQYYAKVVLVLFLTNFICLKDIL